jgi:hypothetical protein
LCLVDTAPAPELIPGIELPKARLNYRYSLCSNDLSQQSTDRSAQGVAQSLVLGIFVDDDSVLFKIEGKGLTAEGLHDGDLLLAKPAKGNVEGKIMIALYDKTKVLIRRCHTSGTLAHFSAVQGPLPDLRIPIEPVDVKYVVTSITRSFQ